MKKNKSLEEQIEHLEKEKKVHFDKIDKKRATEILYQCNYINMITPYKHHFAKRDNDGDIIKIDNKHQYAHEVGFDEYLKLYIEERASYPSIFGGLLYFETTFNAILSYEVITHYEIDNQENFEKFVSSVREEIKSSSYAEKKKKHMQKSVKELIKKFKEYNDSIYITLDRLPLSDLITVFRCCKNELKMRIFDEMKKKGLSFDCEDFETFDDLLGKIPSIRNCVCHGNSIEVLIRYYKIKREALRKSTDKRKFKKIVAILKKYSQRSVGWDNEKTHSN